jgi:hypothetical protein
MVDWMINVFREIKDFSIKTLFLSVAILDSFLEETQKQKISIEDDLLYLLGLGSIFIASKYEEVHPLSCD